MVIKTDTCAFSEYRIYPGHGMRFVRRDGQALILSSSKVKSLLMQRKKPAKLMWTQAWRRLNKKIKTEEVTRRRTRKTTKMQRAVVGASLEEIKKKRAQKPEFRSAQREAALKEIKATKKAAAAKKPSGPASGAKDKPVASKMKGAKGAKMGSTKR
ncbi:unnamed protein product [Phaeothamnion confervicola]